MTTLSLSLTLLNDIEANGKYVNLALNSHLLDNLSIDERRRVTALLYTTVERRLTIDYYITSLANRSLTDIDVTTLNLMRLGACQILYMDSVPDYAAVNESVSLGRNKGEKSFVNALLRSLSRAKESGALPMPKREKSPQRYLSVKYSFPLWICKMFYSLYGEEGAEALLDRLNSAQYTDIVVNTTKITRAEYRRMLEDAGIYTTDSQYSRLTLRIPHSVNPVSLPHFDDGYFFVQDTACTASVLALLAGKGERVVDTCACPGGKSFAASILMSGVGDVLSLDLHSSKLPLITDGARRLGLSNITARECDATTPISDMLGTFDKVICDVPCSGLGVLGKKADMRYSRSRCDIDALPPLQLEILEKSVGYLKPCGEILYSTCTLNPQENEEVVHTFLEKHTDFELVPFELENGEKCQGMFTFVPHIHHTDGFFIAKLRKIH